MENGTVTPIRTARQKTGGRKAGTPNKLTATVKEIAAQHIEEVVLILREIAQDKSAPASARVSACKELLDRAEGRPAQRIEQVITESASSQRYNSWC